MFQTNGKIKVYYKPNFESEVAGELANQQTFDVQENPIISQEWIWHRLDETVELWIPERAVDDSEVLLTWIGPGEVPRPTGFGDTNTSTTVAPKVTVLEDNTVVLPENIDIAPNDYERVQRAAIAITRAFEGGGFASYNNYDRGIVSYGIMQFTLSSGSLGRVVGYYFEDGGGTTEAGAALKSEYWQRIQNKDTNLRDDERFRELLTAVAQEPIMQAAQFRGAISDYWDVVMANYVQRRGNLVLPLTYALLFDMGIHFGVNHGYARRSEEALGVTPNTRPGTIAEGGNGITEKQLVTKIAELRRDAHYDQAARQNLGGLRVRGDFWVNLIAAEDWYLQGDDNGFVYPKSGVSTQVRNPDPIG